MAPWRTGGVVVERGRGPITLGVMSLISFSHLCICHQWKIFVIFFLGTMKARKLKLGINMDNGWMHRAYGSRGQGPITHRVMFLCRFSYLCIYKYLFDWWSGGLEFEAPVRQHSFAEIDHEIFSTVILSLPLIQEGSCQLLAKECALSTG